MARTPLRPLCLTALATLAIGGGSARAQFNVIFPGSTVQGDVLNGLGTAAFGEGLYNLNTASAWAIEADTWRRQNQYLYESYLERERQRSLRMTLRRRRNVAAWGRIHERITDKPELADIYRGDTLNALNRLVSVPRISPSERRLARIGVPGGTLQKIPLVHAPSKSVISLARLDVSKDWPLLLKTPAFEGLRRRYEAAVDEVLAQVAVRELSLPAINALERAVDDLRDAFEGNSLLANPIDRNNTADFLDRLEDTTRTLRTPGIDRDLSDVMGYLGTTVADLLTFMDQHELRFGRAESTGERALYEELYPLLVQYRDRLLARADRAE
jgi:hypothetical protein